ncbi:hypothetical protein DRO26_02960 [Candidatus Bathyarchaeota archaeon]|nr:MAG: hypothetical protein DRO26_02960 [Candidatus Bathyarchaeota archaeon]
MKYPTSNQLKKEEKNLGEGKISVVYDRESDIMHVSLRTHVKSEVKEVEEGIYARYDVKTKQLVGFTIINFLKKFPEPKEIMIPIQQTI